MTCQQNKKEPKGSRIKNTVNHKIELYVYTYYSTHKILCQIIKPTSLKEVGNKEVKIIMYYVICYHL